MKEKSSLVYLTTAQLPDSNIRSYYPSKREILKKRQLSLSNWFKITS